MAKTRTNSGVVGRWQQLMVTLEANSGELPQLEIPRGKLGTMLDRALEIFTQQAALTAGKQEMTRQLQEILVEGQRLETVLRLSIKEHYGIRSEKLAEFGLQPFRGRPRKVKPEAPEEKQAPAAVPKPTPDANL
jgi:hypothetical protein